MGVSGLEEGGVGELELGSDRVVSLSKIQRANFCRFDYTKRFIVKSLDLPLHALVRDDIVLASLEVEFILFVEHPPSLRLR